MKITKRQLRRIVREEISRANRRPIAETSLNAMNALKGGATPSIEEIETLIRKQQETLQSLEGYRGMDPSIEDNIEATHATIGKLKAVAKNLYATRK